jgi:hypothetical protein
MLALERISFGGCSCLGASVVDDMDNFPGTSIVAWHVFQTAAFIKNCRRAGMKDDKILYYLHKADSNGWIPYKEISMGAGDNTVQGCPWGCSEAKIAAGFTHADDPNWNKLPVTNGLVDWHIEAVKSYIANQRRANEAAGRGPQDWATIGDMRMADSSGYFGGAQACPWGCSETKIAEAYRQLDLGYGPGVKPPNAYVTSETGAGVTSRIGAAKQPVPGGGKAPGPTGFWPKYKVPILVTGGLAVAGGLAIVLLRKPTPRLRTA